MTQWEYLTLFLKAEVHKEDEEKLKQRFGKKSLPKYSPESMIPELDKLGAAGWELVHMEPVARVGGKGDVLFPGDGTYWSSQYFCVFKRARITQLYSPPPATVPESTPQPPTPEQDEA